MIVWILLPSAGESFLATLANSGGQPQTVEAGQSLPFPPKILGAGEQPEEAVEGREVQEGVSDTGRGEKVPIVFHWEHGGNQVYICGSFNNWDKTQMNKRYDITNDFK